jgi:hypothetical protein
MAAFRSGWVSLAAALLGALALACGDGGGGGTKDDGGTIDPPPPPPPPPPPGDGKVEFGTQGPWPIENRVYGGSQGIRESPVVGFTTDEAQNRWIATPRALYLVRAGKGEVVRFDEEDGLHLGEATGRSPGPVGWAKYCDMKPIADDAPCRGELIWGGATSGGISAIVGGKPGEVFVGYRGGHGEVSCPPRSGESGSEGGGDWCDPLRHSGKIDRVRLGSDGTLTVDRMDFFSNQHGRVYWHNRTMKRLAYDHLVHPGTLYSGAEHGVNIFFPDRFEPWPGVDFDPWLDGWAGDHLHARVCYHQSCASGGSQRMGDWEGLALDAEGRLWTAGKWTAGLITWDPDPVHWWKRHGGAFEEAFGDPYVLDPANGGFQNEPVFKVPLEGDPVHLTAVTVCPDGRTWFGSAGATGVSQTVAVFDRTSFRTYDASQLGLGQPEVQDLVCLPDGRLVVAGRDAGAVVYDPATGTSRPLEGLPGGRVIRLELDTMVSPPSLHVATSRGAAVLRTIP